MVNNTLQTGKKREIAQLMISAKFHLIESLLEYQMLLQREQRSAHICAAVLCSQLQPLRPEMKNAL